MLVSCFSYWCAVVTFPMKMSDLWQGTPFSHFVGVTVCVPLSVPLELAGAPTTPESTNAVQLPAFEVVESHPQLFAVFGPRVKVWFFNHDSVKPESPTVPARVPQEID